MSKKKSNEHDHTRELRPFMRLGKYIAEDSLRKIEELLFLVSHHGKNSTPSPPSTKEEWQAFITRVHDGWKQAQLQIADLLIQALELQRRAAEEIREAHRKRDKNEQEKARRREQEARIEIRLLRRTLDAVLWTIVQGEHSILRRLFVVGGDHSLSKKNIQDAMDVASIVNDSPLQIALCTDMLSLVHVGDLFVHDFERQQNTFIELKSGKKNVLLSKAAEIAAITNECEELEQEFLSTVSKTDSEHYSRAKRQAKRNHIIVETIKNEKGTDQNTGATVRVESLSEPPIYWTDSIIKCYEQLSSQKRWAISTIDECVHIGVYNDQAAAYLGFSAWMECIGCTSPISNLMDSFSLPAVRPLGAMMLPFELQKLILRGDILVIICLDLQAMFRIGNSKWPGFLGLSTKKAAAENRRQGVEILDYEGLGVTATVNGTTAMLGAGLSDRVIFDQHSPIQLLRHQYEAIRSDSEALQS